MQTDVPTEVAQDVVQFLTFTLGSETFGLDITIVREIIQHCPLTRVPQMPGFVRGVMNLRGSVVPVIDLQARFDRAPACLGKKSCVVIIEAQRDGERVELGLLVDAVSAVIDLPSTRIEPAPRFGCSVRREFIRGIGKADERFIVLLDPDRALDVDEMALACEAAQLAPA